MKLTPHISCQVQAGVDVAAAETTCGAGVDVAAAETSGAGKEKKTVRFCVSIPYFTLHNS